MIKVLIDIPEEVYKAICDKYGTFPREMKEWGLEAIKNGIPVYDNATVCNIEQILAYIERLHYHPKLDFIKNDEVIEMILEFIYRYKMKIEEDYNL